MLAESRRLVGDRDLEPHVGAWFDVAVAYLAQCKGDLVENLKSLESAVLRNARLQACNVGNAYLSLGAYEQAANILKETVTVLGTMQLDFVVAGVHANLGLALARAGDLDGALASETIAVADCVRHGNQRA
jgi:hypothetical protein